MIRGSTYKTYEIRPEQASWTGNRQGEGFLAQMGFWARNGGFCRWGRLSPGSGIDAASIWTFKKGPPQWWAARIRMGKQNTAGAV